MTKEELHKRIMELIDKEARNVSEALFADQAVYGMGMMEMTMKDGKVALRHIPMGRRARWWQKLWTFISWRGSKP